MIFLRYWRICPTRVNAVLAVMTLKILSMFDVFHVDSIFMSTVALLQPRYHQLLCIKITTTLSLL